MKFTCFFSVHEVTSLIAVDIKNYLCFGGKNMSGLFISILFVVDFKLLMLVASLLFVILRICSK